MILEEPTHIILCYVLVFLIMVFSMNKKAEPVPFNLWLFIPGAIFVLWMLTVFYVIKTKWVLVLLFPIPFFKHIILDDMPVLLGTAAPLGASDWLKELCMLSFMLALFFFAVSLKKMTGT